MFDLTTEDLIPDENVVITMTKLGYIKRMTPDNFKSQNRGGKGIKGMQTLEDDYIEELLMTSIAPLSDVLYEPGKSVPSEGDMRFRRRAVPRSGTAIINLLQLLPDEKITAADPDPGRIKEGRLSCLWQQRRGIVKKTPITDYRQCEKNWSGGHYSP